MDELVFDPTTQEGTLTVSMLKGAYSFVSGQIAKSGPTAMSIKTPVMTIGVRGTSGAGHTGSEGQDNSFVLLQDPGGTVGEITLSNAGGTRTINQANFAVSLNSYIQPPPAPVFLSGPQIETLYGAILSANPQPPQPTYAPPPVAAPPPAGHGPPRRMGNTFRRRPFRRHPRPSRLGRCCPFRRCRIRRPGNRRGGLQNRARARRAPIPPPVAAAP